MIDINRVLRNGYGMILAYDHGFEYGPADFDNRSVDPSWIMEIANSGNFTGFVCHKGVAAKYYERTKHTVPLIVKVNGRTSFREEHEHVSLQNCSIDEALELGATGIAYTIYVGGKYEQQMIAEFGKIEREAHEKGLLVFGWMHAPGDYHGTEHEKKTLAYAARLAMELNADAVKIKYTGDVESFSWVVKNAGRTKVFVVGGPRTDTLYQLLDTAKDIQSAGAAGFAIGRNIWQAKDPYEISEKLARTLYGE